MRAARGYADGLKRLVIGLESYGAEPPVRRTYHFAELWSGSASIALVIRIFRYVHSCWFGLIRSQIGGSVRIAHNRMGDPDAMEIVTNTIAGNLACFDNVPHAQVGDSGGAPNVVGGQKRGECRSL